MHQAHPLHPARRRARGLGPGTGPPGPQPRPRRLGLSHRPTRGVAHGRGVEGRGRHLARRTDAADHHERGHPLLGGLPGGVAVDGDPPGGAGPAHRRRAHPQQLAAQLVRLGDGRRRPAAPCVACPGDRGAVRRRPGPGAVLCRHFADTVVAVSGAVAAQFHPANVVVRYDGVDGAEFSPGRAGRFRLPDRRT